MVTDTVYKDYVIREMPCGYTHVIGAGPSLGIRSVLATFTLPNPKWRMNKAKKFIDAIEKKEMSI